MTIYDMKMTGKTNNKIIYIPDYPIYPLESFCKGYIQAEYESVISK